MALTTMKLRLEAADRSGAEEYRVQDGGIEVRQAGRGSDEESGGPLESPQTADGWRRLTAGEVSSHVRGNTVVAQWLRQRIGWRRLLRACTDKETLEIYEIDKSPIDRHAA